MRDVQIVKLPAHVRPAGRLLNASGFVDLVEPRVAIRLQRAREVAQVRLRMLALAIRRVGEPHRRRRRVSRGPVVAHIGPQPSRFCFSQAWRQHRNRRVVGVQLRRAHHVTPQRFHQRRQQLARAAHPVRQRRAFQLHAFARVNLFLPIQRQVIAVFRDQHVRQQSRSGQAARDRTARRFRLHDLVAARAGQLRPHLPDHFEARRNVLQDLRNVFAQRLQLAAAVRTGRLLRQNLPRLARQLFRQRPPRRFRCHRCVASAVAQPKTWPARPGSLPVRPAATPTARSAVPASPTCARTASAAAWRSAASSARSPLRARPAVRLCEAAIRPWTAVARVGGGSEPFSASGSSVSRSGRKTTRAASSCAQYARDFFVRNKNAHQK